MCLNAISSRDRKSRREYNLFFELYQKQPWLLRDDRKDGLELLLDDHCHDLDEQALVCDLLHRFKFLDSSQCEPYLKAMVNQIVTVWQLSETNTQIVAMTADTEGDSAQAILQTLKPMFQQRGWHAHTANKLEAARGRNFKNIARFPNVVLVNEFSGTGRTVLSRVRSLRNLLADAPNGFTIQVCLLASMEDALRSIRNEGVDAFASTTLQKGISQHYDGNDLATARDRMLRLESQLASQIDDTPLPSFGYGQAEAFSARTETRQIASFPYSGGHVWMEGNHARPYWGVSSPMSKRKLTDLQRFILRHLAQSEQGLSAYTLWSRFKLPADNVVEAMNPLVEQGLVRVDGARISLSEEGVGFINERRLGLCQREERPWRQCPPEFREAPIAL